jgi:hypothetical protein
VRFGSIRNIDIPIEQVSELGFDESMYTYSSEQELTAFLTKYTIPADVPQDDISLDFSSDEPAVGKKEDESTDDGFADIGTDFGATDDLPEIPKADVEVSNDISFDMDADAGPNEQDKTDLISGEIDLNDVLSEFADIGELDDIPL